MQEQLGRDKVSLSVLRKMAAFVESLAKWSAERKLDCLRPEVGGAALETAQALQVGVTADWHDGAGLDTVPAGLLVSVLSMGPVSTGGVSCQVVDKGLVQLALVQ